MSTITGQDATNANDEAIVVDYINQAGVQGVVTVGTTAVEAKVGGSRHANRKTLIIEAKDNTIYWGFTSGVTISTGIRIFKDQHIIISIDDSAAVYLIADGASKEVRVAEA